MRNLNQLCTYHCGTPHERVFKITASFLLVFSLVLTSAGTDLTFAAEQEAVIVAPGAPVAPLPPPSEPPSHMVNPPAGIMPPAGEGMTPPGGMPPNGQGTMPPGSSGSGAGMMNPPGGGGEITPEMRERMMRDQAAREAAMTPEMREQMARENMRRERERFYNDSTNSTPPATGATTTNTATSTTTATGTTATPPATDQLTPEMKERMMKEQQERTRREERRNSSSSSNQQRTEQQKLSAEELETQDSQGPEEFVDPRQLKEALQQIKNMRRELDRFARQLKKTPNESASQKIEELKGKLANHEKNIKEQQSHDAMRDFWDEQLWEEVNLLRAQVELPKEIANIKRELTRLEKLLKLSSTKKGLPIDLARLQANIEEIRAAVTDAQTKLAAGEGQEAMEALQVIHDGRHPGEIMGVIYRLKDVQQRLKSVRDKEIRAELEGLLEPIIEAANDGDFREAHAALNEIMPEMMRLIQQATKSGRKSAAYDERMSKIEDMIQRKFSEPPAEQPAAETTQPTAP